ncbi:MAG: peptide chain release factor N(5)-glutamine methyltransferase [Patescibacteria group bacterium]
MKISEIISQTCLSRLDVEVLLANVLDKPKEWLFTHSDFEVPESSLAQFRAFEKMRLAGKSVAAILGRKEFFGLEFSVDENVLIPRPETEILVEEILKISPKNLLDVGTGSGAIAIAVAKNLPNCRVVGSDISPVALEIARKNAAGFGAKVEFIESDLLARIPLSPPFQKREEKGFEMIVANLPYIPENSTEIEFGVKKFEPSEALFSGADGLDTIRKLLDEISQLAEKPKNILLEFGGEAQRISLEKFAREKFPDWKIEFISDLAGIPRVLRMEGL